MKNVNKLLKEFLLSLLPNKPYCSMGNGHATVIRSKESALGANDILAIISTKSKHKLMTRYFHNYVLIYRTVLPAHENALIVQKRFLPSV